MAPLPVNNWHTLYEAERRDHEALREEHAKVVDAVVKCAGTFGTLRIALSAPPGTDLVGVAKAMARVVEAARARRDVWTRETLAELDRAFADLDALRVKETGRG